MSRHRAWCFTINNYTATDEFSVSYLMKNKAKYGICGKEVAPSTGTPHLQCYIHLQNPLSLNMMRKFIPRAHFIVANGSDNDNHDYCNKGGNAIEWGEMSEGQGARLDIKEVADKIRNLELTEYELMFDYPELYVRYGKMFEKMFKAVQPQRQDPPQVIWRWGLAGVGKTRYVMDRHTAENVYIKDNTKWWDGYNQQKVILFDDFDNDLPYRTLLRILDRYPYQGQVKCGYVNINSPIMYITCEYPPEHYWSGNQLEQVTRRLAHIEEII